MNVCEILCGALLMSISNTINFIWRETKRTGTLHKDASIFTIMSRS